MIRVFRPLVSPILSCASLAVALLCLSGIPLQAQQPITLPGTTVVGNSAPPQMVMLTLPQGGAIASIQVLTQGSPNVDFTLKPGGTCVLNVDYLPNQQCTVAVAFTPTFPGQRRGAVVLLDSGNHPLATQTLVANATGAVATFIPGTINTVAGNTAWIYAGDGGAATQSSIFLPFGVAIDGAGDVYLADSSNNRIRRVDANSGIITTVAGNGNIGSTGDGGPATAATLSGPSSVALDPAGNLYIADSGNNIIRRIDAFTGIITTVAGSRSLHGYSGDNGPALQASLNTPNGLALDTSGNIYVADSGNNVVRLITSSTGIITTVAGNGVAALSGDNSPAVSASLDNPWSVTLAPTGELYIADQNNNRIREVNTSGIISTIAGTGVPGFSGDAGPAISAQLSVPASVALDIAGNLYIADSGNNRVRKISGPLSAQPGTISTIAGNGGQSFAGDDGPADQAGLYGPYTLALDGKGNLFIADVFHNRIREISANSGTLLYVPMRAGRVSAALAQTIENDGNAPLTPQAINVISQAQIDAVNTTCSASTPLAPSASCVISAEFAPTTLGDPDAGLIDMLSNAANAPSALNLLGQVLDTDPTTVTLTSSANPSVTGSPVTFSVVAVSTGVTPTGVITLLDGSVALGTATLAAGSASFTINGLAAGQHTITATYSGDSSNAAGTSAPLLQVVQAPQAATVTNLTTSASPINAGATLHLSAAVSVATAGSGSGTLAGNVNFSDGATFLGSAPISNGVATFSLSTLAVGTHALTAAFVGSTSYSASTSAVVTENVTLATTHMSVSSSASPSNSGAPLTLTATIFSNGGVPTGLITFLDGGKALGTATLSGQGIATLVVPAANWTAGTHTLTATYAGDANDGPCSAQPVAQVVNLATASLLLASSANPSPLGASITFTASASSNGGMPTGVIQFLDGASVIGSGTLSATGVATLVSSTLTVGSHSITAAYAGDTYDSPATSAALSQTIQATAISVNLASSANPATYNAPLTFSVAVTGTGVQPAGTVTLTDNGSVLATLTLDANGNASYTISTLGIGTHPIVATYSGDSTHTGTSAALSQRVVQATTTTLSPATAQVTAGLPTTLTAVVTGTSGKPVTGSIAFIDGGNTLATLTPDQTGTAVYRTSTLAPGRHAIIASFAGDPLSAPSASTPSIQTVTIATTSTTLVSSANPAFTGTPLTLSATVTGNGGTPTGSVNFSDGATVLATVPLATSGTASSGTASFTVSTLLPGIHQLTAAYSGDTYDGASLSAALAQQIAAKPGVTISSSENPALLTDNVTLTIAVVNGTSVAPTGSVTVTDNGSTIATPQLDASGHATVTLTSPALGTHTLIATYSGDADDIPATSAAFIQTVTLRPTTTSFSSSSNNLSAGQQLILVSVVQGSGPKPPTGQVTFQSGTTTLGVVTISSGGVATLTLNAAQATLNAVAVYSGDSLYAPSTSPAIIIVVGPPIEFTLSTPGILTMQSGQHATLAINVATAPTFTDTLGFGCAGLPADATCTFSTDQVAVGGGLSKTLSVTVDTGNPLGAGALASLQGKQSGPLLALIPAAILLGLLRRKRLPLKLLACLIGVAMLATLSGCASSFSQKDTPPGAYTFQIVATGNQSGATGTATVQMTVTQ